MTSDVRVAPGQGAATAIPVAENAQKDAASPATDATPSFSSQGMQSPSLLKKAGDVRVLSQEPSVVKELETRDPLPRSATKRPPLSSSDAEETPPLPIPPETPPRALEFPLRFLWSHHPSLDAAATPAIAAIYHQDLPSQSSRNQGPSNSATSSPTPATRPLEIS
mmetsp:Transcript_21831/g.58248  ORF Transcript_21831/g.58248 Transcript_21831/m.58248 type:complete len:165 (-) Transcript_21831:332-826(-)